MAGKPFRLLAWVVHLRASNDDCVESEFWPRKGLEEAQEPIATAPGPVPTASDSLDEPWLADWPAPPDGATPPNATRDASQVKVASVRIAPGIFIAA